MRVLHVEERQGRIKRLAFRVEESLQLRAEVARAVFCLHALPVVPMLSQEGVAVDSLAIETGIVLVEDALPAGREVRAQHVLDALVHVGVVLLGMVAVGVAVVVVVADHEHLLDWTSVGVHVVREHGVPSLRYRFHLLDHAVVRHVAGDHHGVDVLVAEPFERMLEGEVVAPGGHLLVRPDLGDVDVRDNAEAHVRLAARHESGGADEAVAAKRAQRARASADEEVSTCDVH